MVTKEHDQECMSSAYCDGGLALFVPSSPFCEVYEIRECGIDLGSTTTASSEATYQRDLVGKIPWHEAWLPRSSRTSSRVLIFY